MTPKELEDYVSSNQKLVGEMKEFLKTNASLLLDKRSVLFGIFCNKEELNKVVKIFREWGWGVLVKNRRDANDYPMDYLYILLKKDS